MGCRAASVGLRLLVEEDNATLDSALDIDLVSDFATSNGVDPGPIAGVGAGYAEVFGVIDFFAETGYGGTALATFELTNLAPVGSEYGVSLEFYFPDTRTNFADYGGNSLDANISLGTTIVKVIPEPGIATLLILLLGLCAARPVTRSN